MNPAASGCVCFKGHASSVSQHCQLVAIAAGAAAPAWHGAATVVMLLCCSLSDMLWFTHTVLAVLGMLNFGSLCVRASYENMLLGVRPMHW